MPPGKKGKKSKERLDKYYYLAKEQGYRARSAFKLMQLNRKFGFLGHARALVDLCAAPGGWLQVASKHLPVSSVIIGVDLVPIKPIPNVITLTEDITTQRCRAAVKKALAGWKADVVLHDGAPNVGQSWVQDAFTQCELVLAALRLAAEVLVPGGWFVTKVFRSKDYNALLRSMSQLFRRVSATKPPASRNVSAEIFVVCEGFKSPKKLDRALLDPLAVFGNGGDPVPQDQAQSQPGAPLQTLSSHAKAQGYADDVSQLLERKITVHEFLGSADPLRVLTSATSIVFDDSDTSKFAEAHLSTSADLKEGFPDIRLLGKTDFKRILRWRLGVNKDLAARDAAAAKTSDPLLHPPETEEEKSNRLVGELDGRIAQMERQERKRTKRQRVREQRMQKRREGQAHESAELTAQATADLFKLSDLPSDGALAGDVDPDEVLTDEEGERLQALRVRELQSRAAAGRRGPALGTGDDEIVVGDEARTDAMEEELDRMYEEYREARVRGRRLNFRVDGHTRSVVVPTVSSRGESNFMVVDSVSKPVPLEEFTPAESGDQLEPPAKRPVNSLVVPFDEEAVQDPSREMREADLWFGGGAFEGLDVDAIGGVSDDECDEGGDGDDEKDGGIGDNGRTAAASVDDLGVAAGVECSDSVSEKEDSEKEDGDRDNGRSAFPAKVDSNDENTTRAPNPSKSKSRLGAPSSTGRGVEIPKIPKPSKVKGDSFEVVPAIDPWDYEVQSSDGEAGSDADGPVAGHAKEEIDDTDEADSEDASEAEAKGGVEAFGPHLGRERLATTLALGQKIALSSRARARLLDDAYNRYAFPTEDALPEWFATDERRNNKPQAPVTRAEVDAMKARLVEISTRPMHKVAEAEGRRMRRAQDKQQRMRLRQLQIESSADMGTQEKTRAISRMWKRAAGHKRGGTVLINGKTRQKIGGAKTGRKNLSIRG